MTNDGNANPGPFDRPILKKAIFAGLVVGFLGAAALLLAEVIPTIEFFAVMGAAVGIMAFIVGNSRLSTGGTESDPTYG